MKKGFYKRNFLFYVGMILYDVLMLKICFMEHVALCWKVVLWFEVLTCAYILGWVTMWLLNFLSIRDWILWLWWQWVILENPYYAQVDNYPLCGVHMMVHEYLVYDVHVRDVFLEYIPSYIVPISCFCNMLIHDYMAYVWNTLLHTQVSTNDLVILDYWEKLCFGDSCILHTIDAFVCLSRLCRVESWFWLTNKC